MQTLKRRARRHFRHAGYGKLVEYALVAVLFLGAVWMGLMLLTK